MRVPLEQLVSKLKNNTAALPKIILINGNEPLLIEEALDDIRQIFKAQGFDERIKYQVESGFDWSQLTGAGQAMSLFSQRRLIELRVPKTLGTSGIKAVTEYFETP